MKLTRIAISVITGTVLTACAGLPPNASELAAVPIIQFGQPLPEGKDYILHFPAGSPLPVSTKVGGNLFVQDEQATLNVTLKREVYLYGQFASFDGQNWKRAGKLIETKLELQIPQKNSGNAGLLQLQLNQK
jgi:hypothetical protein